jgi:hypothetical protein
MVGDSFRFDHMRIIFTVTWLKDNRPIDNADNRISIVQNEATCKLSIVSVKSVDKGRYTVCAKNDFGQIRTNIDVSVLENR